MSLEDYDPERETVKEFVQRRLKADLDEELRKHDDEVLYGEGKGEPLTGLLKDKE